LIFFTLLAAILIIFLSLDWAITPAFR
jgi:hypothetical protein